MKQGVFADGKCITTFEDEAEANKEFAILNKLMPTRYELRPVEGKEGEDSQ
ncbi:hypothetical protein ACTFR8_23450 [Bacillus cereus group sp. MYBK15-3]|uniref:hypothetical protein n=1 Tax=Bacillus cereus group TaxID=86661 RepID=UPI00187AEE84|nr:MULTISPECIES: hypothetical protein [Bacillus cereus group]MBX9158555.1 hypothetical protein [Bacillus cereus]